LAGLAAGFVLFFVPQELQIFQARRARANVSDDGNKVLCRRVASGKSLQFFLLRTPKPCRVGMCVAEMPPKCRHQLVQFPCPPHKSSARSPAANGLYSDRGSSLSLFFIRRPSEESYGNSEIRQLDFSPTRAIFLRLAAL